MKYSKSRLSSGFTLLEMVIVMGIIAVLAGGVITLMGGVGDSAKIQTTNTDISGIKTALKTYEITAKTYPSTQQGLDALVNEPSTAPKPKKWVKQMERVPLDPWNNPYLYEYTDGKVIIRSKGPDGKEDTEDDISSDDQ